MAASLEPQEARGGKSWGGRAMRRPVPVFQGSTGEGQVAGAVGGGRSSPDAPCPKSPLSGLRDLLLWCLPLRVLLVLPPHRWILHGGPKGEEGSRQCLRRGDLREGTVESE